MRFPESGAGDGAPGIHFANRHCSYELTLFIDRRRHDLSGPSEAGPIPIDLTSPTSDGLLAANLGPAMESLVREYRPATLCLVNSDSHQRSQKLFGRLSTRGRQPGFGSLGERDGSIQRPRRLPGRLARLSNRTTSFNLRRAAGLQHIAARDLSPLPPGPLIRGILTFEIRDKRPSSGQFTTHRASSTRQFWESRCLLSRETAVSPHGREGGP